MRRRRPRRSASRSISLVPVLPTEPVTATTEPRMRARAAAPMRSSAASGSSGTTSSGPAPARRAPFADDRQRGARLQAPARRNRGRRGARRRSRRRPRPARCVRLSIETPEIAARRGAFQPAAGRRDERLGASRGAHAAASGRSAAPRAPRPDRRTAAPCRRRLAGLVALAGNEQDVAFLERGDGRADRGAAVADLVGVRARRRAPPGGSRPGSRCADCRR